MKKIGEIIVSTYFGHSRIMTYITKDLVWKENIYVCIYKNQNQSKLKISCKGGDSKENDTGNFTTITEQKKIELIL